MTENHFNEIQFNIVSCKKKCLQLYDSNVCTVHWNGLNCGVNLSTFLSSMLYACHFSVYSCVSYVQTSFLEHLTSYTITDLESCVCELRKTFQHAVDHPQQAVYRKYKQNRLVSSFINLV